jgi:hypothetical protein
VRLVVLALLLTSGGFAQAQSLGDAARRAQDKKKPASPAPGYTEDDLTSRRRKPNDSVSPPAVAGSPAPPSASPAPEPDRVLQEREWRARFREARARIAAADARAYEDRVEVVFVSGIPVQQNVRVKVETPELREARKALDDLEEELRRSGGLPGWGRE